jgi:hypothetical protein
MTAPLPAGGWTARGVPPAHISVPGARLRVRALIAMGHSTARIARALGHGTSARAVRRIARGGTTEIPLGLRRSAASTSTGGTSYRPSRHRPSKTPPRPRAAGPGAAAGAPAPAWTTTNWTSRATSRTATGGPPPAPASPPTTH